MGIINITTDKLVNEIVNICIILDPSNYLSFSCKRYPDKITVIKIIPIIVNSQKSLIAIESIYIIIIIIIMKVTDNENINMISINTED